MTQTNDPPTVLDIGLIPNSNEKADLNAPSDSGGKLVVGQAPNITITETAVVADADERLTLDVQEGDIAIQTNVSTSFIFTGGDNIATNWETLDFDAVGAINGETISPANVNISGLINGADTSAAAAGEALTSDGSGSFAFASLSGSEVVKNGSSIEYVALNVSNLPAETGSGDVALLTASDQYVKDYGPTGTPFDISSSEFTFDTDIPTQDASPTGITWNDDGSRLYEVGDSSDRIYQSTVSTPYDITTASFDTDIPSQDSRPTGMAWNDDGSRLYEVGFGSDRIYQSTVSTPYDITTASFDTDIPSQDETPLGIQWNDDGSRLYEVGAGDDKIYQSTVSTPYDITTASFDTDINTQDGAPEGMAWNDDGSRLYEVGFNTKRIYQYTVSSPFDIDTASIDTNIPTQDSQPKGMAWNDDGSRLYEVGTDSDKIYQYTVVSSGWEAF